jgi:hypothetical protein
MCSIPCSAVHPTSHNPVPAHSECPTPCHREQRPIAHCSELNRDYRVLWGANTLCEASCRQMIDVLQTAKHRLPDDLLVARFADWQIHRAWSALADRAVRAPVIEIPHILGQHSADGAIEDEQVVQAFSAQRSHPALGDRICLRRPEWGADLPRSPTQPTEALAPPCALFKKKGPLSLSRQDNTHGSGLFAPYSSV